MAESWKVSRCLGSPERYMDNNDCAVVLSAVTGEPTTSFRTAMTATVSWPTNERCTPSARVANAWDCHAGESERHVKEDELGQISAKESRHTERFVIGPAV